MANPQHIKWLLEGVEAWNHRRNSEMFTPDLEGVDIYREFRKARKLDRNGRIPLAGVDFGDSFDYTSYPNWFHDEIVNPPGYTIVDYGPVKYSTDLPDDEDYFGSNAKLIGVNLVLADLAGANLSGADLTGSNLAYADCKNAKLSDANFSNANLSECRFIDADLNSADLTNSILRGADLTGTNLAWVNLTGAHLVGVDLSSANLTGSEPWKAVLYSDKSVPQKRYPDR